MEELPKPREISRVGEAAISQPLCTALQITLVHILYAAGVGLAAVVGHSSGEIAAAYGHLDAWDAMRITFYRGFYASFAREPDGKRGRMMAVGKSLDQLSTLCKEIGCQQSLDKLHAGRRCTCRRRGQTTAGSRRYLRPFIVGQHCIPFPSHTALRCTLPRVTA